MAVTFRTAVVIKIFLNWVFLYKIFDNSISHLRLFVSWILSNVLSYKVNKSNKKVRNE
jgi:hypothetical protein